MVPRGSGSKFYDHEILLEIGNFPTLHRRLQRLPIASLAFTRLGNLPLIPLKLRSRSLDRRELDKQEVEQPEVDKFDLDEPRVGKLELD
ncbi:hypothetical protein Tco_0530956 [Tanacetum coccineum]